MLIKKCINAVIVFLVTILMIGCNKNPIQPENDFDGKRNYFPLKTGNTWYYSTSSGYGSGTPTLGGSSYHFSGGLVLKVTDIKTYSDSTRYLLTESFTGWKYYRRGVDDGYKWVEKYDSSFVRDSVSALILTKFNGSVYSNSEKDLPFFGMSEFKLYKNSNSSDTVKINTITDDGMHSGCGYLVFGKGLVYVYEQRGRFSSFSVLSLTLDSLVLK